MQAPHQIRKKIQKIQSLGNLVTTMKNIASVGISHYERRVHYLRTYQRTVESGFQILLRSPSCELLDRAKEKEINSQTQQTGVVLIGSQKGLCGEFNARLRHLLYDQTQDRSPPIKQAAIGTKILKNLDPETTISFDFPENPEEISGLLLQLLDLFTSWLNQGVGKIHLYYNQLISGLRYEPVKKQIYPFDPNWLESLKTKPWKSRTLPTTFMSEEALFTLLSREALYISLHRAFTESLACESAARLVAMEAAEQNLDDHQTELQKDFQQKRQTQITEELFDIVSGFEVLKKKAP